MRGTKKKENKRTDRSQVDDVTDKAKSRTAEFSVRKLKTYRQKRK